MKPGELDEYYVFFSSGQSGEIRCVPVYRRRERGQGNALAGMLYLHVRRLRDGPLAAKGASQGKINHANVSEIEKGRAAFRKGAHRTVDEKREIGRKLIEKKAQLPRGHFGPWLRESGLSPHTAHRAMRLARAA